MRSSCSPLRRLQIVEESSSSEGWPSLPSPIDVSCTVRTGASPRPSTMDAVPATPSCWLDARLSSASTTFCRARTPITCPDSRPRFHSFKSSDSAPV
eukprot:6312002-Prymnesium_polylepis.1